MPSRAPLLTRCTAGLAPRTRDREAPGDAPPSPSLTPAVVALVLGLVVVVAARLWGNHVYWADRRSVIGAAPFFGRWDVEWRWWLLAAVAVAAVVAARAPDLASRLTWRKLVVAAWALAAAWAVTLAASEGLSRLAEPLVTRFEYYAIADQVDGVGRFLSTYVDRLGEYPTHVKSHPPGMVVVYWVLDQVGLGSPGWAAVFVIGAGTSAVVAVLLSVRSLADEATARAAAPFVAVAPAALWVASTADAVFAAAAAWATWLAVAATDRHGRAAGILAAAAGVALGCALHLSYGLVLAGAVPLAVVLYRRRFALIPLIGLATVAVTGLFLLGGFWWFDGLSATRGFYEESSAAHRPYWYSLVGNLGILALVVGPAAVAGWGLLVAGWRRCAGLAVLVGAAGLGVLISNVSGLSKAETERIWLPFTPWLLAAAALVPARWSRPALAASAATALVLETWLVGPW